MFDSTHPDENLDTILAGLTTVEIIDPESVDHVDGYREILAVLERLVALAGETLGLGGVEYVEGDPRELRFADGQVIRLVGNTDWADHEVLVDGLNRRLTGVQLYSFWSRRFGQEQGFVALPPGVGAEVALLVAIRKEEGICESFYPDGERGPRPP